MLELRRRLAAVPAWARGADARLVLLLLLPLPPLLVAHQLHVWELDGFGSRRWDVDRDRSSIEVLGYLYLAAAIGLLVLVWRRQRERVYAGWALALTVVVADDALELHESGGRWLAARVRLPSGFGLQEKDVGQLATWALLGALIVLALWLTHRPKTVAARADSRTLLAMLVLLMVFAVGFDVLNLVVAEVTESNELKLLLLWTEAGGEVGVMAVLGACALHIARRDRPGGRAPSAAVRGQHSWTASRSSATDTASRRPVRGREAGADTAPGYEVTR